MDSLQIHLRSGAPVQIRSLREGDYYLLRNYLDLLSVQSRSRFGPHSFDELSVKEIFQLPADYPLYRYVAMIPSGEKIIAYMLMREGLTPEERIRFGTGEGKVKESLIMNFAPSVADEWQNSGLGTAMYKILERKWTDRGKKMIVLWGGVQATNNSAICYYEKLGFRHVGSFWHNGVENYDMTKLL